MPEKQAKEGRKEKEGKQGKEGQWFPLLCLFPLFLTGCSEIQAPTAAEAMTHPFGTGAPFTLGTTKAKVLESWGTPKHVAVLGVDELGSVREEWIYEGWLPGLPIDHEYVSRTKHLFFEGENLVRWKEEAPPGAGSPNSIGK